VLIDRGNAVKAKQAMLAVTEALQQHDLSIWVFAEGTRNHGKGLGPLKKGAFVMAINAGVPIVPVCASTYVTHMKLNRWHSGDVVLRSLDPIPTTGLTLDDVPALMERCRTLMVECIATLDAEVAQAAAARDH
jgi:1-acyl-sn-glycerol-3-phosphate acyltransferase